MSATEQRQTDDSTQSSGDHKYFGGSGGNASVHDRTGLLVAIISLTATAFFAAVAVMGYVSNRDENERLQQQISTLMVEIKDLQIELDEYKKR